MEAGKVNGMPSDYATAVEYARSYRGGFEFMQEMRKAVENDRPMSPNMVAAILRCKARAEAEAQDTLSSEVGALDLTSLPDGTTHFAVEVEGALRFLRVDKVVDGGWQGWIFVKEQHSENYTRLGKQRPGGTYIGSAKAELSAILADPMVAAVRYGKALGRCAVCHTTLTEEKSRELGIGPVCRKRFAA